jgi:indolepyruvate ferredoxin oxidoreductase, alpha subunit
MMFHFLSGNEAVAHGAWKAGVEVACSYPGTPATEIIESLSQFTEMDVQWSVNEKVAFEVALGAAFGGVRSLFACKHVGLNVAMDPLMTSAYTGINGGMVIVVADDPGVHSSQNEQDTRWVAQYAKLPLIEPSDPQEVFSWIGRAFEISEEFDTPILFHMTTRLSHCKQNVEMDAHNRKVCRKPFACSRNKYVMLPSVALKRHAILEKRMLSLQLFAESSEFNVFYDGSNKKTGFITSGISYQYVTDAFPDHSILKLGLTYPLCTEKVRQFAAAVEEIYVVEELDPVIANLIRSAGIEVKTTDLSYRVGELNPDVIMPMVKGESREIASGAGKRPEFCKGCAYRTVFKALQELDVVVAGDIGCYTIGALEPFNAINFVVCMGCGITLHEGLRRSKFNKSMRLVGVIGDSTFLHSGITGLINAGYNGCNGVILILDNGTTAMTGGQNHPSTGRTIIGRASKKTSIEAICLACGADTVDIVEEISVPAITAVVEKRLNENGLNVIIIRSLCLLNKKRQ